MKTITEYAPMIFSQLADHAERRIARRRRLGFNTWMVCGYCAFGIWLGFDTGFAPWHWQFWLIFTPLFMAGEIILHTAAEQ